MQVFRGLDWYAIISMVLFVVAVVLAVLAVSIVWIMISLSGSVVAALFSIRDST